MIPIPPWAYFTGAAIALAGSFGAGWQVREWRCEAAIAEMHQRQIKEREKTIDILDQISASYEKERADAAPNNVARQQTIRTIYRDRTVFSVCAVPDDARRLLEGAVADANARAAGQPGAAVPGPADAARRDERP